MTNTMRWAMFICLFIAAYLSYAGLKSGANLLELAPIIWGFLAFGVGGQSFASWLERH
jgi:hypothetical protein